MKGHQPGAAMEGRCDSPADTWHVVNAGFLTPYPGR